MILPPDLHEDDLAIRRGLRELLIGIRKEMGLHQWQLASRIGVARTAASHMEAKDNWRLSTIQRWARGLDHRLILYPATVPPESSVYREVNLLRPLAADLMKFDREATMQLLVEARTLVPLTQREVGEVLGVGEGGVGQFEHGGNFFLIMAQRYCRAVGTVLVVELEEITLTTEQEAA